MRPPRLLLLLWLLLPTCTVAASAGAVTLPAGFQDSVVVSGRTQPTAARFAPDGRLFVAEKSGLLFVYDGVDDPSPVQVIDLRASVHNFWDRGLLGLAVHPDFPNTPEVFVLYSHDTWPPGDPRFGDPTQPRWGVGQPTPGDADPCPTPPGATGDGCVIYGRLSRIHVDPLTYQGHEHVLIEGAWCQQYPSHSVADLAFGPDGMLYVTAGDGAAFHRADVGDGGSPVNPCDDPPDGIGGPNTGVTAEGGALRSQDLLSPGDPVGLSGSVLRIDVSTDPPSAPPDNPRAGGAPDDDFVVAMGLRNPFRIAHRPGTGELWIGDVGWNNWEEIDRLVDPRGPIEDFGWPCDEGDANGSRKQPSYDQQTLCQALYAGAMPADIVRTAPWYAYRHSAEVVAGDGCGSGGSSVTGLAFPPAGSVPPAYAGALIFGDSTRQCLWAMHAGPGGLPDPSQVTPFLQGAAGPIVDLQVGPDGHLYYVELLGGTVHRISWFAANQPPTAVLSGSPTTGPAPLSVQLDASGSSDPEDGQALAFDWDLDGDGVLGDASGPTAGATYTQGGTVVVRVRVTDSAGAFDDATLAISVGNSPPAVQIDAPPPDLRWIVDQPISFAGSAVDPEDGPLPASQLSWDLVLHHCYSPTNCHSHPLTTAPGVAGGVLPAPDHDYPAYLEFRLTARDLPPADWWDVAWPRRRRIGVDNSAQATALVDFPVLVTLDPGRIDYATTAPGGADLRFTDASGVRLPHEVEVWSPGGVSRVWVKLPAVPAASAGGFFWMYYGNPAAGADEDPAGVWSPDHVAVWHLHGDLADSTANANDGADQGSTRVPGAVGDARHFDGAAWIDVPSSPSLELTGAVTLEAWVGLDDPDQPGGTRVLSKKNVWNGAAGYSLAIFPLEDIVATIGAGGDWASAYPAPLDTSWHHVAATIQGGTGHVYVDGTDIPFDTAVSPLAADAQPLAIGRRSGGGNSFLGAIDELRISRVARSPDWIRAQVLSMSDAFLAFGPVETPGTLATTVSRRIDPEPVVLDFASQPPGLTLVVADAPRASAFSHTAIVGSRFSIAAPPRQVLGGAGWQFDHWSDGGAASHDVVAPAAPAGWTAFYTILPQCDDGIDNDGDGRIDWAGGPAGEPADPQCLGDPSLLERRRSCGLGFELALLVPWLWMLRRGRRR